MAALQNGDHVIYSLLGGKMVREDAPIGSTEKTNFLIVCDYGDWSGFRTLAACEAQFASLEAKAKPDYFFQVVER
jgi:hypothetical protein